MDYTVRQRQRIGAKMARYSREIDDKLKTPHKRIKGLVMDLVANAYKDGFKDGVETEREAQGGGG